VNSVEKSPELTDFILEIAAKHFAEKGFSGARVDEIAADAGVNKATMYYRIGNKQALYEHIFVAPLEATLEGVRHAVSQQSEPTRQLRAYIKTLAEHMAGRYRYFPAVMMREVVSGAERIPERGMLAMCEVQKILREVIAAGIETKQFRTVNPFLVHMLIMGSLSIYTTGEPMRKRMMQMFSDYPLPVQKGEGNAFPLDEINNMIMNSVLKGDRE